MKPRIPKLSKDEASESDAELNESGDESSLTCLASHDHKLNLAEAPGPTEASLYALQGSYIA